MIEVGTMLADKAKLVFKINTGSAVLGLGYIIGLRYSAIITAGSLLVWLVIVPLFSLLFGDQVLTLGNPDMVTMVRDLSPEQIFRSYGRHIGIGGIAMAGVIGIVRSWSIIKSAIGLASKEFSSKGKTTDAKVIRTQRDLPMKIIAIGSIVTLIAIFIFFPFEH